MYSFGRLLFTWQNKTETERVPVLQHNTENILLSDRSQTQSSHTV